MTFPCPLCTQPVIAVRVVFVTLLDKLNMVFCPFPDGDWTVASYKSDEEKCCEFQGRFQTEAEAKKFAEESTPS